MKSQAESTYSTSGSGSPTPHGRRQFGGMDSDDAGSLVTRESSYLLKQRNGPLPHYLPSSQQQQQRRRYDYESSSSRSSRRGGNGGSVGRILAVFNCRGSSRSHRQRQHQHPQHSHNNRPQQKDHVANYIARSNSRLTNVTTPVTRRSFEDNDMQSQCSGAPLLFTQTDTAAWTTTV